MSAGTLALTNKSDAVKGTGTTFTEMKAGDFIVVSVGGTPYTLTVKSIASDTQLTLISKFTGPTQSGLAWYEVPREAQSLITAALATQTTEALRGQNLDKDNWQQVFSVSDDITVTLKDGSQFTGPSWLKIVDLLKTVDLAQAQKIADQIRQSQNAVAADKATVAADRGVVESKAAEAAASAQAAAQHEQAASDSAGTASQKATDATAEADRAEQAADDAEIRGAAQVSLATTQADRAKEEADRAAASNPENALLKAENLADVENKAQALQNLLDEKPLPLGAPAINPNHATTFQQLKSISQTESSSFGVINSYASGQSENSSLEGGRAQSEIRVAGSIVAKAALLAKKIVGGEAWAVIEITDTSGSQQSVKSITIPNLDGSTLLSDKSLQAPVAWVSFNGADGSIFGSHNVSSVSKSSGGLYEINFITNTQDTKYAVVANAYQAASQTSSTVVSETGARATNKTTVKVMRADSAVGVENAAIVSVIVMGRVA